MNRKSGRNTDGTFAPGNAGKPKGTRHKATQAALVLLEGEGCHHAQGGCHGPCW